MGAFTVVLTEVVRISKLSSFFLNMCFKKVFCSFCLSQEKINKPEFAGRGQQAKSITDRGYILLSLLHK